MTLYRHIGVIDAVVHRVEEGKEAGPADVCVFQVLLAAVPNALFELGAETSHGIRSPVEFPVRWEETTFFGEQEEHDSHHHGDGTAVDLVGGDVAYTWAASGHVDAVDASDSGDEQFDSPTDLDAEGLGDVLLVVLARLQKGEERFLVGDAEKPGPAEDGHERTDDIASRALVPVGRVENGRCGNAPAWSPDQDPPTPADGEAELDVVVAA